MWDQQGVPKEVAGEWGERVYEEGLIKIKNKLGLQTFVTQKHKALLGLSRSDGN